MSVFARVQGTISAISATLQRITLKGVVLDAAGAVRVQQQITAAASVIPDVSSGTYIRINQTTNVAVALGAPLNPIAGQVITLAFVNTSGGAAGAVTFNAVFKLAGAWVNAATGNNRKATFYYDGTNWIELSRNAADVPN